MICKDCKYFSKQKIIIPSGAGMCENGNEDHSPDWNDIHYPNYKKVISWNFSCDKFKRGQYQNRKTTVRENCKRLALQTHEITRSIKAEIAHNEP